MNPKIQAVAFLAALLFLGTALGVIGLRIVDSTNQDSEPFDQGAYTGMSRAMEHDLYPGFTDGTRNPLFPWLAAKFFDPNSPEFFAAGKRLNVVLAAMGSMVVALATWKRLGGLSSWAFGALAGLGCLLPMGTFFGAEVLFYLFFFAMWVLAFRQLQNPSLSTAALLGLVAGLAYLAKPSTSPFLGMFTLFTLGISVLRVLPFSFPEWILPATWKSSRALVGLAVLLACFFAITAPRLLHSAANFGSPFYSLPSFWFWADDWETCVEKYSNCTPYGLSKLPKEEWPTAANYFRRNPPSVAIERLLSGTGIKLKQLFVPDGKLPWDAERAGKPKTKVLPGRGWYLLLAGFFAIGMLAWDRGRLLQSPAALPVALFGVGIFALYTLAYGWYHVIGPGHRFVMMFYIPLAWTCLSLAASAANTLMQKRVLLGLNGFLAFFLALRLMALLMDTTFQKVVYAF